MNRKQFEELYFKAHQKAYKNYFPISLRTKSINQLIFEEDRYIYRKLGKHSNAATLTALLKRIISANKLVYKHTVDYLFHENY